jgi:hypothetical protein
MEVKDGKVSQGLVEAALLYVPAPRYEGIPYDPNTGIYGHDPKLTQITGVNPQTNQSFLRVVYGMDYKQPIGGKQEVFFVDPNGKYVGVPYLVLMCWNPPTVYNRAEWEANRWGMEIDDFQWSRCQDQRPPCQIHAAGEGTHQLIDPLVDVMGPFPEKGVWDTLCFLRNPDMSFAHYTLVYEKAREWRYNAHQDNAKVRVAAMYKEFLAKRWERKRKAEQLMLEQMQQEIAEDLARPVDHSDKPFSFSQKVLNSNLSDVEKASQEAIDAKYALPSSAHTVTPSGLVVKRSALEGN